MNCTNVTLLFLMSFIVSNTISLSCLSCFLAPPSIDYTDPLLVSATKENVTFTCHASGLPEPTFTWITPDGTFVNATAPVRKVAEKLDDDSEVFTGKELQEDGSLLVYYTRVDDEGVYKCVATNDLGQAVGNVSLTVREGKVLFYLRL